MSALRVFWSFLFVITLIGAVPSPVTAAGFNMSVGTGYLQGFTRYQLGGHFAYVNGPEGNNHFPISELKFPLDAPMLRVDLGTRIDNRLRLRLNGQTNLNERTGKMEDSDWVHAPGQLDVFSRSDTEMRAWLVDGVAEYSIRELSFTDPDGSGKIYHSRYYGGLGFKYQKFEFDCSNLYQWWPSDPSRLPYSDPRLILKYEVEYQIPYLLLGIDMTDSGKLIRNLHLGFAPFLHVEDKDQHLLRGKTNTADHGWGGYAFFMGAEGRYELSRGWYLAGDLSLMVLESKGVSVATFSGAGAVDNHSIDEKIKSQQISGFIRLGYDF